MNRKIFACLLLTVSLAACASPPGTKINQGGTASADSAHHDIMGEGGADIEITGSAFSDVTTTPMVPTDPSVTVYPLGGPINNPLTFDRTHSVLDNTTAGGYTVFDDSVTVYPLPGDDTPTYLPSYTVPPLVGQVKPDAPMVGAPVSLTSSNLPPVPTIDVAEANPYANPPVPGAVRTPLSLDKPAPTTMQPPARARAPMLSPFSDPLVAAPDPRDDGMMGNDFASDMVAPATASPRGPRLTGEPAEPQAAPVASPPAGSTGGSMGGSMVAGRRSPSLTGY